MAAIHTDAQDRPPGPGSLPDALRAAADRWPDREAVVDGPTRLSWAQLRERVTELARFFLSEGIRPGARVAVAAPNTWHWVVAALGASCAGATLVPVSTRFTAPETLDVLHRSGATALVLPRKFLGRDRLAELHAAGLADTSVRTVLLTPPDEPGFESARAGGPVEWADLPALAARTGAARAAEVAEVAARVGPEEIADILFTSGTTGRSKGACSSHRQALGVAASWAECAGLTEADRYLVVNPFFHSFGYKAGILACLLTGATLVPMPVFDAARALELIERERITVLPGPPTLYRSLLDCPARAGADLSSLRVAVTGAANVPVALVEELRAPRTGLGFTDVLTAYGLTEAVVATMCRPGDDPATVARSCGRAVSGFTVRIGSPDDTGAGEVLLRGPNVMLGYLDDPAATAAAVDGDGWLHTGDVGRLDERGYLSITDRIKDMYICGGFNVYPAEVEQELARLPEVAESAVVGVPDPRLGEVGRAYLVTRPGAQLSEDTVLAFCRERIAGYKVPRQVVFRAELPRNAGGKVLKTALRAETAVREGSA